MGSGEARAKLPSPGDRMCTDGGSGFGKKGREQRTRGVKLEKSGERGRRGEVHGAEVWRKAIEGSTRWLLQLSHTDSCPDWRPSS